MLWMTVVANAENVVKIFSNNDNMLQKIGQILASPKSRKIYSILTNNELNTKEIAKLIDNEENPRLPNIIFHLEKMIDAGIICMDKKQQRKNGHYLKYYKAIPSVLVVSPNCLEDAQNNKTLDMALKQIIQKEINRS